MMPGNSVTSLSNSSLQILEQDQFVEYQMRESSYLGSLSLPELILAESLKNIQNYFKKYRIPKGTFTLKIFGVL